MQRIRRSALIILVAVVAAFAIALPAQAATTTEETGPLVPRTQHTYVYDFASRIITDKETGQKVASGIDLGQCPMLFPGDAVESIPEETVENGDSRKGFGFVADDDYPLTNRYGSRGPLEVTGTEKWGGETYITSFKNTGDNPVLVWANSSKVYSSERVTDETYHNFVVSDLDFVIFPRTQPVKYECVNEAGVMSEDDLATAAYYTDEENPTVFYAEDALANRYEHNDYAHGLTVHRPYIEGYRFCGSSHEWKCWLSIFEVYGADDGWKGDATEIYPQWRGSAWNNQALAGKPDEHLLMQFKYAAGRTLTLDAKGGTIDGFESRIYEVDAEGFDANVAYAPVREGYEFAGWCADEACTKPVKSIADEIAKLDGASDDASLRACHLYAKWVVASDVIDADPTDEANHGAEVAWISRNGIASGWEVDGGREFRGGEDVARCDMAAFLYRMADLMDDGERNDSNALSGDKVASVLSGVSDCTPKTAHAAEVAWMIESGISRGWANEGGKTVSFRPMAKVTRQDMAAFLYRFADLHDDGELNGTPAKGDAVVAFADVRAGDVANHAAEVEWLASVGVAKGWQAGADTVVFRGAQKVARQDMAAFMYRLYGLLQG